MIRIELLLETLVRVAGSELILFANAAPALRMDGHVRALEAKPFSAAEVLALASSITPDSLKDWQHGGQAAFDFVYQDEIRFRVSLFFADGEPAMILRRIGAHAN